MVVGRGTEVPRFFLLQTDAGGRRHAPKWLQCVKTLQDLDGGGRGGGCCGDAGGDVARDCIDTFCAGSVFAEGRDWFACVAADADLRINFDLAQERDAENLRHALAFAVAENVNVALTMRAIE